ncbi:hypothetical protein HYDPIDRAFT_111423 [Hydnomerulius pinastri MD-312]|uniref:DUF6534 domain-containing protein n=1 Tax=Hydnomerulius pinastri MD-312 TaxID=994086 RepID=A0A0C9WG51_9AGAM|nr:hypothetical protein HYDPIDRAFT_111423 [Hydnomerulius pinastri MD-312]
MSASLFTGINLGLSDGPVLAGVFISLVFYGVTIMQIFIYYVRYPKDKAILKLLVAVVFLLETLHKFLACAGIWNYLVQHYGDFANLSVNHPPLLLAATVTSFLSLIVQSFFVWRIWSLNNGRFKWAIPAVLMPFVTAQPVLSIYFTVKAMNAGSTSVNTGSLLNKVANASNGTAAAVDITIAIAMCILLAMGRTGFSESTDRMILRLMVISVNTGLWTALFALVAVILLVVSPTNPLYAGVYTPLGTLYCNTLLANLNVRSYVRSADNSEVYQHASLPAFRPRTELSTTEGNNTLQFNITTRAPGVNDVESDSIERKAPADTPFHA